MTADVYMFYGNRKRQILSICGQMNYLIGSFDYTADWELKPTHQKLIKVKSYDV